MYSRLILINLRTHLRGTVSELHVLLLSRYLLLDHFLFNHGLLNLRVVQTGDQFLKELSEFLFVFAFDLVDDGHEFGLYRLYIIFLILKSLYQLIDVHIFFLLVLLLLISFYHCLILIPHQHILLILFNYLR